MTSSNSLAATWTAEPMGRVAAPLREQVIAALRQAILDFQLKPGQRLVERELIEQLGVSRTTVREALRELTSEGLVTVVPQRGAMVSAPSRDEIVDLYEIRAALESMAVKRFVERASNDETARLRKTVAAFSSVTKRRGSIMSVLRADGGYYDVLFQGSRSPVLKQMLESVQSRVQALRSTSFAESERTREVGEELSAVVDAIAQRKAGSAARLAAQHVRNAADATLRGLAERSS